MKKIPEHSEWSGRSIIELAKLLRTGELSVIDLARDHLARIEQLDGELNAFITIRPEQVLQAAKTLQNELRSDQPRSFLHGIPIGLKDLIYTQGLPTTMGAELVFGTHYTDAHIVEKLCAAGALIIGKLNTHQFAYGPTGDRSYYGPAHNPWNPSRMTGGSSSGSGAAVAAGLCVGAIGTDTGGSIRIPAACCGIVGMKPTFGRVSRQGVYPLSQTLDHVGPMTRTVRDNALLLRTLAGWDATDSASFKQDEEDFTRLIQDDRHQLTGKVIGLPEDLYFDAIQPQVREQVLRAAENLRKYGAKLQPVSTTYAHQALRAQRLIIAYEAYAQHQQSLSRYPEWYESEVRERLEDGASITDTQYAAAVESRAVTIHALEKVFARVDAILTPGLPMGAPLIDQRNLQIGEWAEPVRHALTRLTGAANFTGIPALVLPCGQNGKGLPIGVQLLGPWRQEAWLYQLGAILEKHCPPLMLKSENG